MPNECTTTRSGNDVIGVTTCTRCTGQPYIPSIDPHVVETPMLAWNAGANSVLQLDGDVRVAYEVSPSAGIVTGFAPPPRAQVIDPATITHGWYTYSANGALFAQPIESGLLIGDAQPITKDSVLEVRRVGGQVFYRVKLGAEFVEIHVSARRSVGALLVGAAQFASGDAIE